MKVLSGGCCCFQGAQPLLACPKSCDTVSKFTVKVEGLAWRVCSCVLPIVALESQTGHLRGDFRDKLKAMDMRLLCVFLHYDGGQ